MVLARPDQFVAQVLPLTATTELVELLDCALYGSRPPIAQANCARTGATRGWCVCGVWGCRGTQKVGPDGHIEAPHRWCTSTLAQPSASDVTLAVRMAGIVRDCTIYRTDPVRAPGVPRGAPSCATSAEWRIPSPSPSAARLCRCARDRRGSFAGNLTADDRRGGRAAQRGPGA